MITYRLNHDKILEGLLWITTQAPELDHYWVVKVMFGADKMHMNKYGRPVFGDRYVAMKYGPVPSHTLRIINRDLRQEDQRATADAALNVVPAGLGKRLVPLRSPNIDLFSRTDIECLSESLSKYRGYSFDQLVRETHAEPAWRKAWGERGNKDSSPMDFLLLLDDSPSRQELVEYITETAAGAVF